eukprot:COSAG02_NODE_9945_length_2068_cov_3.272219_2_plen_83_part_00
MDSPQEGARNLPEPKRSHSAASGETPDSSRELREAGSAPLLALLVGDGEAPLGGALTHWAGADGPPGCSQGSAADPDREDEE